MTVEEKLRAMEAIWRSLSKHEDQVPVPHWHKQVLDERQRQIDAGEARFVSLEEMKLGGFLLRYTTPSQSKQRLYVRSWIAAATQRGSQNICDELVSAVRRTDRLAARLRLSAHRRSHSRHSPKPTSVTREIRVLVSTKAHGFVRLPILQVSRKEDTCLALWSDQASAHATPNRDFKNVVPAA
ncbi:MAG: addiction module protein [Candidatus Udaeobacter sp.]